MAQYIFTMNHVSKTVENQRKILKGRATYFTNGVYTSRQLRVQQPSAGSIFHSDDSDIDRIGNLGGI